MITVSWVFVFLSRETVDKGSHSVGRGRFSAGIEVCLECFGKALTGNMEGGDDADSIVKQLGELKVTEVEKACVFRLQEGEIDKSRQKLENAILCKVFSNKKINPDIFSSKMPKIWNQEQTLISCVGFNIFLCKFRNAHIKCKILEGDPWFFDKAMILMEEPKGDSCGEEVKFRYVSFWTHFHKLPFACFTRKSVKEIGSLLGRVEQIDLEEESEQYWRKTLRIKIQIEVSLPLKRGIFLSSGTGGADKWIKVTYEKLPDFCYGCGLLGHTIKECASDYGSKEEELSYGRDLREPIKLFSSNYTPTDRYDNFGHGRGRGRGGEVGRGIWRKNDSSGKDEGI